MYFDCSRPTRESVLGYFTLYNYIVAVSGSYMFCYMVMQGVKGMLALIFSTSFVFLATRREDSLRRYLVMRWSIQKVV